MHDFAEPLERKIAAGKVEEKSLANVRKRQYENGFCRFILSGLGKRQGTLALGRANKCQEAKRLERGDIIELFAQLIAPATAN